MTAMGYHSGGGGMCLEILLYIYGLWFRVQKRTLVSAPFSFVGLDLLPFPLASVSSSSCVAWGGGHQDAIIQSTQSCLHSLTAEPF